jgi:hypothetical protein
MWVSPSGQEGVNFWLTVLTDLRNLAIHDQG